MTLDEAKLILNLKQDISAGVVGTPEGKTLLDQARENMTKVSSAFSFFCLCPGLDADFDVRDMRLFHQNYDHLFKTNAPPAPKGKEGGGSGSFYIQSKIVRARERIEAEWALNDAKPEAEAAEGAAKETKEDAKQQ